MENARDLGNLTLRGLRRHEIFDLDLRKLAYSHPVATTVVLVLYGGYLHSEVLPDEPTERPHRSSELPRKDPPQPVRLLLVGGLVHEHRDPPVAICHDLGRIGE